jgi:hypothetical protein
MKKIYLLLLFTSCCTLLSSQSTDSLAVADSLELGAQDSLVVDSIIIVEKKGWLKRDYPSPKKALIIGLVVPGGGQIYNKSWWKLPLVYGAMVGMGFTIDYNQSRYRRLRTALDLKRKGEPHEFENTTIDNLQSLKNLRDEYDKNTQLAYVGMFLVYSLQAVEAFVDAHLKSFDVEDDIGFRIRPEAGHVPAIGMNTIGIGLSIPLYKKPMPGPESQHSNPFTLIQP